MEESQEIPTQSSGGALLGRPLRRLSALVLLALSLVL